MKSSGENGHASGNLGLTRTFSASSFIVLAFSFELPLMVRDEESPVPTAPLMLLAGGETKPAARVADLMAKRRVKDRDCMVLLLASKLCYKNGDACLR
mmetsp:Transcript_3646/g.5385  ORF Transcript_3646/g.5385 Transcript_3646/m.5385 type:complete len:98 (+) Transcript_3646:648-941(+)